MNRLENKSITGGGRIEVKEAKKAHREWGGREETNLNKNHIHDKSETIRVWDELSSGGSGYGGRELQSREEGRRHKRKERESETE
mgnify:CR=1 FL=1